MIRGFDHFKEHFAGMNDHYVVVGGVAATLLLEEARLSFRATKDIDVVIISADIEEFAVKLIDYVKSGNYKIHQKATGKNIYYRFKEPAHMEYPFQIEIFHKKPEGLALFEGQHLIPLKGEADGVGLSAILLEEEYFDLIKGNIEIKNGIPVTTVPVTIILKARAYNDLLNRKINGDQVDNKDIVKHRNDIFRLSQVLDVKKNMPLHGLTKIHFEKFVADIENSSNQETNQALKNLHVDLTKDNWLNLVKKFFLFDRS